MRKRWGAVCALLGTLFVREALAQEPPPDNTPSPPPVITIVPPPNQPQQPPPPAQTQQPQPPPALPPPEKKDEGERQGMTSFGIGFAYAANLKQSSGTKSAVGYGLVLEFGKTIPLTEQLDFGLR